MGKENLFESFAESLYMGSVLEADQRYRADSALILTDVMQKIKRGELTTEDCLTLGRKIDGLCTDAYSQGMVDGINFGIGMRTYTR